MKEATWLVLLFCFSLCLGQNPGIQVQINFRGLDLLQTLAAERLVRNFRAASLRDQLFGSSSVTSLKIVTFEIGRTNVSTRSPNVIRFSTSGAAISVSANYRYRKRISFFTIRSKGNATVTASDIDIEIDTFVGRRSSGRPELTGGNCRASIGNLDINLSRGLLSIFFNLFKGLFLDPLREELERAICSEIQDLINTIDQDDLATYEVFVRFSDLKLSLVQLRDPSADSSGITFFFNGQICSIERSEQPSFPFEASAVPILPASSKMVQILISEYVLDTFLYTAWQEEDLDIKLSHSAIESSLGLMIGQLGIPVNDPNQRVNIRLSAVRAPNMTMSTSGVQITTPYRFEVFTSSSGSERELLFTLQLDFEIRVILHIIDDGLAIRKDNVTIRVTAGQDEIILESQELSNRLERSESVNNQIFDTYDALVSGFQPFKRYNYFFHQPSVVHGDGYVIIKSDFVEILSNSNSHEDTDQLLPVGGGPILSNSGPQEGSLNFG